MRRLFRLPLRGDAAAAADVDEELQAFLGERVNDLVAQGMSPTEARAPRRFGGSERRSMKPALRYTPQPPHGSAA
jgi:hypothetical protein